MSTVSHLWRRPRLALVFLTFSLTANVPSLCACAGPASAVWWLPWRCWRLPRTGVPYCHSCSSSHRVRDTGVIEWAIGASWGHASHAAAFSPTVIHGVVEVRSHPSWPIFVVPRLCRLFGDAHPGTTWTRGRRSRNMCTRCRPPTATRPSPTRLCATGSSVRCTVGDNPHSTPAVGPVLSMHQWVLFWWGKRGWGIWRH